MKKKMNALTGINAFVYVIALVGALNWGLIGLFEFDLVAFLFGNMTLSARSVYALVGLCAIISVILTLTLMSEENKL